MVESLSGPLLREEMNAPRFGSDAGRQLRLEKQNSIKLLQHSRLLPFTYIGALEKWSTWMMPQCNGMCTHVNL